MTASQIRLNKATREWVIYAPDRLKRPQEFKESNSGEKLATSPDNCPFCPGKEEGLGKIILELPNQASTHWQTRVIPNKFPALSETENTQRIQQGLYVMMSGYGRQEVVIESPNHDETIATMPLEAVELIVDTYHQRYLALMEEHENMMAIIFRNHGRRAGASLHHPHSQIIATGIVPQHRRWQEDEAQRYYDEFGRCLFCDILKQEIDDGERVVVESELFLAFVPFAADVPYEVWIMPKNHQADFGSITAAEKLDFAVMLKTILGKLYHKLNNPDYNYVINTAARYKADEPQLHWYCEIRPRLTTPAGFEIGSGISINPSLPENDAAFLRS